MAETITPPTVPTVLSEIRQHGGFRSSQVAKWVPAARGTGHANPSTIWRYMLKGVETPSGTIKLECVKLGMSWVTSEAAFQRFVTAITSASMPATIPAPKPVRSAANRRKASEAAGRKLAAMGA